MVTLFGQLYFVMRWITKNSEVFPADNPTKDEMQTFLLEMENLQMKLDTERTPMNITNLTLKNLS